MRWAQLAGMFTLNHYNQSHLTTCVDCVEACAWNEVPFGRDSTEAIKQSSISGPG